MSFLQNSYLICFVFLYLCFLLCKFRNNTLEKHQLLDNRVVEFELDSSCRCDKISYIFSSFDSQKFNLLKTVGFADIIKLPFVQKLNLELCIWLLQRLDSINNCLHLHGGVDLYFRDPDVYLVLGIPFQGQPVKYSPNQSKDTMHEFRHKLFTSNTSASLSIPFLEHTLTKEYGFEMTPEEEDAFIIAAVLYAATYLLAPDLQVHFPMELMENFVGQMKPGQLNWAQFVLTTLGRSSAHATSQLSNGCKKISLFGCCLFLQVYISFVLDCILFLILIDTIHIVVTFFCIGFLS